MMFGMGSETDGKDLHACGLGKSEGAVKGVIATVGSVKKVTNDFLRLSLEAAALASVGCVDDGCVSDFDLERANFGGNSTASMEKITDFDLLAFGSITPGEFGFESSPELVPFDCLELTLVPELALVRDFLRRGFGEVSASFRMEFEIESAAAAASWRSDDMLVTALQL